MRVVLWLVAVGLMATVAPVHADGIASNVDPKVTAIMTYLDLPMNQRIIGNLRQANQQMNAVMAQVVKKISPTAAPIDIAFSDKDIEDFKVSLAKLIYDTFTLDEINALNRFYSSPEGKSVGDKMPEMQKGVAVLQAQMLAKIRDKISAQLHGNVAAK